jgi:hypothetical protein
VPRRETVEAIRQEQARRRRRRQLWTILGSTVGVLAIIGVIVGVGIATKGGGSDTKGAERTPATQTLRVVAAVPASVVNTVAGGIANKLPAAVQDEPLTSGGKPQVLYVGAEYCPYCAAERWPMVQALSRFGTFDNLSLTTSASDDVNPNTPTFSFHGATYTSPYLSLAAKELYTNKRVGGHYEPLDKLTSAEQAVFQAHSNGFPFIDLGGKYVIEGATYPMEILKGMSAPAIAAALANPDSTVSKGVMGAANGITAALCDLTGGQPANVCTAPGVAKLAAQLNR